MNELAIVILNWNGRKLLEQFLPSVVTHSPPNSIYVIDNASDDDSVALLSKKFPQVQRIQLKQNLGYAGGYNEGLKQINAQYYCLLNSDVMVTKNWVTPILKHFNSHPDTGIIQPHLLDFNKKDFFEYAGAAGGYIDRLGYPFCRGRILNNIERDSGQYDSPETVFWASGACFFVRKEVFDRLGGFDVDFFAHQEEIDFCWRAFNKGYVTKALGTSKVYHVGAASLPISSKKVYLNHRNSLYMLIKNLPKNNFYSILLQRLFWDGWIAIGYLIQFKPNYFFAVLKAHLSFYSGFRLIASKREKSSLKTDYFKINNLLIRYYLYNFKKISSFDTIK